MLASHRDDSLAVFTLLAVGLVSTLWLVWNRWLRRHLESVKPFPNLPMPPGNHFLYGHLAWFMKDDFQKTHKAALDLSDENGRVGFFILRQPSMFVSHWEDARSVLLQTDSRHVVFLAKYHISQAFGGRNLALLQGREWKVHRNAVIKCLLAPCNIRRQQHAIQQVSRALVQALLGKANTASTLPSPATPTTTTLDIPIVREDNSLKLDVFPLMKMATLDVFGLSVLGTDFESCQNLALSPMALAFDVLGNEMTRRIASPAEISSQVYSLPTQRNRMFAQSKRMVRSFVSQLILEEKKKQQEQSATDTTKEGGNMIASLLQVELESKDNKAGMDALTEQTMSDVLLGLVFAGYETTSICLTYALYLLARHPIEQEYCFQEAQRLSATVSMAVEELVYCQAVILESLRLYPPAYGINRKVEKDLTLHDGFVVPAGSNIILPIWSMQRMEHNFVCPNEFRPDRWVQPQSQPQNESWGVVWVNRTEENEKMATNPIPRANAHALVAFSAGSRSCAGQKYAMQEAIFVLAGMVKEFEFQLVEPSFEVHAVRHGMVQCPEGGLPLRLKPRRVPSTSALAR